MWTGGSPVSDESNKVFSGFRQAGRSRMDQPTQLLELSQMQISANRRRPLLVSQFIISANEMTEEREGFLDILSSQRRIPFPFLGIIHSCWLKKSKPLLQEFQLAVSVSVLEELVFLKEPPLRYFILKNLLTQ